MGYIEYNPNPVGRRVGDCAVRAVARALDTDWESAYIMLVTNGFAMDGGMSNRSYRGSYDDGMSRRYSRDGYYYDDGVSYRRGRDRMGRFVSRDGSEMARQLRNMMETAPNDQAREEIRRLADKMENM